MANFWGQLKKPFFALAPMADVTDAAFRCIIAKYGKPDVLWTEFVSADGLVLAPPKGRERLLKDLIYTPSERPIVAQFFTADPEHMKLAAAEAVGLGFDGVDINMGCPDRSVEKQHAGAALMKDPSLAQEIIAAAKEGAGATPVSVKTRLGYNRNELDSWLPALLETEPAAITIHARTRKEMSAVPAHWEEIKRAVELRDAAGSRTLIIGNGDVASLEDAKAKADFSGADGVMFGRAIFGNPWLFDRSKKEVSAKEKLRVLVEHTKLFEELFGGVKNFSVMKKHYKSYVNGFEGAKELRIRLMEAENGREVESIVGGFQRLA
jgi:nifR3 family TIM-barrel protein